MKAVLATVFIERSQASYLQTDNPIHAWRVYTLARQSGVPIPDWVLDYFNKVAKMLTAPPGQPLRRQSRTPSVSEPREAHRLCMAPSPDRSLTRGWGKESPPLPDVAAWPEEFIYAADTACTG
jgi:hypothetical protein